jgi:hypothetical protein
VSAGPVKVMRIDAAVTRIDAALTRHKRGTDTVWLCH